MHDAGESRRRGTRGGVLGNAMVRRKHAGMKRRGRMHALAAIEKGTRGPAKGRLPMSARNLRFGDRLKRGDRYKREGIPRRIAGRAMVLKADLCRNEPDRGSQSVGRG